MGSDANLSADVVIVGGGPSGLTLALALARAGLSPVVIDAEPPELALRTAYDGRAFAIAFACWRMWRALGVTDALIDEVQPINRILCSDGRTPDRLRRGGPSPYLLHFDRSELAEDEPLGVMVPHVALRRALHAAVQATPAIRRLAPMQAVGLSRDVGRAVVTLADGRTVSAPLAVACDGVRSQMREWLGIRSYGWNYAQSAVVCTIATEHDHGGVAHEYFLPAGPFALLPLPGRRANLVWTETHAVARALMAMDDVDFHAEMTRRLGDFLGAAQLAGPRYVYPLELKLASRFVAERACLVGDAAHRIHPIAGQGLNLGLKDVAALAEVIVEAAGLGLDWGQETQLRRYESWRRGDTLAMAAMTDVLDRLFSSDLPPVRLVRGVGMDLVGRIAPARRFLIRHAGGAGGDLPRLLRGEALVA
jgi:2-octaprenyl-6-methoxyphenol hydroxylase